MIRRVALASCLLVASCDDSSAASPPVLQVVAVDGTNPIPGRGLVTARATFRQDLPGIVDDVVEAPIVGDTFDLGVPITSYGATMQVSLELLDGGGVALRGGTPAFFPAERSTVSIVVGAPGTCQVVPSLALSSARENLAAVLLGAFVLVVGGEDASGASAAVDSFDLLSLQAYPLAPASAPLGPARAAPVDRETALILSRDRAPYLHRLFAGDPASGRVDVALHEGVSTSSAIAGDAAYGAVVVGGDGTGAPSATASWVLSNGNVASLSLPRALGELTVGRGATGFWAIASDDTNAFVWQMPGSTRTVDEKARNVPDGFRHDGILVVGETGGSMLLIGGTDAGDVVRIDTLRIAGCPTACGRFMDSPVWTNARRGVAVQGGILAGGEGPSALVEQVIVLPKSASIVPFATLSHPRTNAAVVQLPTGVVLVFGGRDASGLVAETEMCWGAE